MNPAPFGAGMRRAVTRQLAADTGLDGHAAGAAVDAWCDGDWRVDSVAVAWMPQVNAAAWAVCRSILASVSPAVTAILGLRYTAGAAR